MIGLYEATTNGWSGEGMALPLVDPSNPILLACHNLSFILCLEFHIANISPSILVVSSCAAPVSLLAWPYLLLHYIPYPQAYVSKPLPLPKKESQKPCWTAESRPGWPCCFHGHPRMVCAWLHPAVETSGETATSSRQPAVGEERGGGSLGLPSNCFSWCHFKEHKFQQ